MCRTYFNGVTVPEKVIEKEGMSCDNSYCLGIDCTECINYPSIVTMLIRQDYLMEKNKDEYISEGIERISDGD